VACLVLALAKQQPKILGQRTETNYPSTWMKTVPADKSQKLFFLIALKQRNLDVLEQSFWAISDPTSPEYRNFLTIDQIDSIVNPAESVVEEVVDWLTSNGVSDIEYWGDAIKVRATVEVCERVFSTQFHEFVHKESGKKIVRQFGQFSVPHKVAEHIDLVSGLSEFPMPRFSVKRKSTQKRSVSQVQPAVCPQSIQNYYAVGSASVSGSNTSVGVIEFEDQYFAPSDLSDFASSFNVAATPLTKNHIIGSNDPTNPQLEATLDIEYALAVGQNAVGWFWIEGDNVWLYGFAKHMSATTPVPWVASISYGWNEEMQCEQGIGSNECQQLGVNSQQYVARVNTEFQKIGVRGISLICASGDSGANGRTDPYCSETHLNPVFPAASPYITSCGATQIDADTPGNQLSNPPSGCSGYYCVGSGGYEEAVSYNQANFASGGGFSDVASVPAYQAANTQAYLSSGVPLPTASYFNAQGRGFPDVSAFGDNVLISSEGQIEGVGGTSCASPIFAGIVSLLLDQVMAKTSKPLGFLNPLLYQMAKNSPKTFKDIVKGDNICTESGCSSGCQGFRATVGWDPVTGLGTPNYAAMKTYLATLLKYDE